MSAGYQVSVRRKSKMASVELRPLTVKVKSPDPRDSTNDQKSLPRADLLRQIPRLHPASPPCGLTLIGALRPEERKERQRFVKMRYRVGHFHFSVWQRSGNEIKDYAEVNTGKFGLVLRMASILSTHFKDGAFR